MKMPDIGFVTEITHGDVEYKLDEPVLVRSGEEIHYQLLPDGTAKVWTEASAEL